MAAYCAGQSCCPLSSSRSTHLYRLNGRVIFRKPRGLRLQALAEQNQLSEWDQGSELGSVESPYDGVPILNGSSEDFHMLNPRDAPLSNEQLTAAVEQFIGPGGAVAVTDEASTDADELEEQEPDLLELLQAKDQLKRVPRVTAFTHSEARADVRALRAMDNSLANAEKLIASEDQHPHKMDTPELVSEGLVSLVDEASDEANLLPPLQIPEPVPQHRGIVNEPDSFAAISSTSKFLERFQIFKSQLQDWGYFQNTAAHQYHIALKRGMTVFARSNPDLLYSLPVRDLHIFVKKFKAFAPRTLERKMRAASHRLLNLYSDFHIQPTFNGSPQFQDVIRLIRFVATEDFSELENRAPGIVAAASELLPSILIAAAQPVDAAAQRVHSTEWAEVQAAVLEASEQDKRRKEQFKKQKSTSGRVRAPRRDSSEYDDSTEQRLESMEADLASRLRSGKGMAGSRPWSPWDEAVAESPVAISDSAAALPASRQGTGGGGKRRVHDSATRHSDRSGGAAAVASGGRDGLAAEHGRRGDGYGAALGRGVKKGGYGSRGFGGRDSEREEDLLRASSGGNVAAERRAGSSFSDLVDILGEQLPGPSQVGAASKQAGGAGYGNGQRGGVRREAKAHDRGSQRQRNDDDDIFL